MPDLTLAELTPHGNQLKTLVDLLHRWGMGVILDVVYNHVGGQIKDQAASFWNFEQAQMFSDDDSSYNTSWDHAGPCFAKKWDDNAELRPGNLIWWDGLGDLPHLRIAFAFERLSEGFEQDLCGVRFRHKMLNARAHCIGHPRTEGEAA